MLIANYPTKKDAKAAIGKPLKYIETSMFGPEYQLDGRLTVCNRPHITGHKREWFGIITMENGLIKRVE
jgi:hypothetical protein